MARESMPVKMVGFTLVVIGVLVFALVLAHSWFIAARWSGEVLDAKQHLVSGWLEGEWAAAQGNPSDFLREIREHPYLTDKNVCAWVGGRGETLATIGRKSLCASDHQDHDIVWQSADGAATVRFHYAWNLLEATGELFLVGIVMAIPLGVAFALVVYGYLNRKMGGLDELIKAAGVIRGGDLPDTVMIPTCGSQVAPVVQAINHLLHCIKDLNLRMDTRKQWLAEGYSSKASSDHQLLVAQSLSHEIIMPTRMIAGWTKALREANEHGDRLPMQVLDDILETCRKMDLFGTSILALGKITSESVKVSRVDISTVVRNVARFAKQSAARKSHTVNMVIQDGMSADCDAALLELVFLNLLKNALVYTANRDHADIAIGMHAQGAAKILYVRDNGIGFDRQEAVKIFQPFKRLNVGEEGHGIGLATCMRIVEAHGGRLWADGVRGVGAVFYISLGPCEIVYPIDLTARQDAVSPRPT